MAAEWAIGIASKAAGPILGKLTITAWQRVSLSWIVAWRARGQVKALHLPVPEYWSFRRYLSGPEPLAALKSGDPERVERLAEDLRRQPFGASWALTADESSQVVSALLSAYTQGLTVNEAIEVQSSATRAEIRSALIPPASVFDSDLQFMAPLRAKHAKILAADWPAVQRFVHEFVAAEDPATALRDWAQNRPSWLGQPNSQALLWMADLASDFGLNTEAIELIDQGLKQGATPAAYWEVRRELLREAPTPAAQRERMMHQAGHPLADAIIAALDNAPARALDILKTWETPEAPERALKTSMQCQFLAAQGDIDGAVRLARLALENDEITGPAQLAADYLLHRGTSRESRLHFSDLEISLELALDVRNRIRRWRGPSHRAVATAIQAAQALGNSRMAWKLTQTSPNGEATVQEASNKDIRQRALIIAAEIRPDNEVVTLLENESDPLSGLEAKALMAEHREDKKAALELWLEAANLATTPSEQFRIGLHLAMHGTISSKLQALASTNEDLVSDIKLIAEAFSGVAGQFEALRTRARQRRPLAFALYKYFDSRAEFAQAAQVAANAAEQWSDAELWFTAANAYLRSDDKKAAVECARHALATANSQWGKQEDVWRLLIENLSAVGRWAEAAEAAAQLMSHDPHNPSAVWALVECQMRLGQLDEAWRTYADFGGKPSPRNEHEAIVRIELWRRNQKAGDALSDLLKVLDAFSASKQVRVMATKALLGAPEDLPEAVSEQIRTRFAELLPSLEDVFVPQTVDLDDPLATLDTLVAQIPDTSDLDRQVEEGELPFGLAASVHHRSYVELLACRTGTAFSGNAAAFNQEVSTAISARNLEVVVDVSALEALGHFEQELGDQLLGYIRDIVAPLEQMLDSIQALDALAHRSTMSVGRTSAGTAQIHTIPEQEADQRFSRAKHVHTRLQGMRCQGRSTRTNIPSAKAEGKVFVWLTALDLAMDEPRKPLWCDDASIRQLAASLGIESFGTSALIEAMRRQHALTDDLATTLQAILINHHHVGSVFRREWLEAAAVLDGWRAGGCASYIAWAPLGIAPEEPVRFVLEALTRSANDPGSVQGWVEATSRWLIRIGAHDAYSNLVLFLQRLLEQSWLTANQLPFVLAGVRAAATKADIADPFEEALASHYQGLTETAGPELASQYVRGLVQQTEANDRWVTHRIILTSN
ncbi:tetratricopeptide repeat protein [Pseudarthrobacter sp. NamE2]|nr:tetratricopeptide repeat protein [Pseudarthrobacter sp. NamE2]